MEIHEFAERVLFATNLEEKLQCPTILTDEQPGSPLATPAAPGRPARLRFKPQGFNRAGFPGLHRLEQQPERGRLLHFFANHELLATELMALVLLKFPEAPAAFRKGVVQTLRDEQEHTRLYLERIKSCGIEFGELPVSGYFWRCVAPMENPIEYVAGLCLTFEQANLDFARHFAQGFGKVGDETTASLLERIYRDEIGHVAYGLKWFRRWKNPSESDWEAFCRTLKFPLSPQRAKGFKLNVEGRRAAGLDPQFIAQLNIYSQSRGRTPGVFVFNPFAEGHIAGGKAFNPKKHQVQLTHDLQNLPQFLCRQDDIVLIEQHPSLQFLSGIKQAGFPLPEFVEIRRPFNSCCSEPRTTRFGESRKDGIKVLAGRKLGRLRPWAWSPDSVELFRPLFARTTVENRDAEARFNQAIAQLYSKVWSANLLRNLLNRFNRSDEMLSFRAYDPSRFAGRKSCDPLTSSAANKWLCTEFEVGVAANSLSAALKTIADIRQRGHQKIVVKEAVGLAGSNALRIFEARIPETSRRWIERTLAHGQQLVIEPWLERVADFSAQLEMTLDGLKLLGYTGLLADSRGGYRGNWAESHHHSRIPTRVVAAFREPRDVSRCLLQMYADTFALIETKLRAVNYLGPLGIDAFVYRDAMGAPRLKPIVELNPRYTMGRVTIELMRQTCQPSFGLFRLITRADLRANGCDDFAAYARELTGAFPLRLEGDPTPRIREGAVCLNDPNLAQSSLAVFQVARDAAALFKMIDE